MDRARETFPQSLQDTQTAFATQKLYQTATFPCGFNGSLQHTGRTFRPAFGIATSFSAAR